MTKSDNVRILILIRLPMLGYEHNRFLVGDVFASIVASIEDDGMAMAARDALTGKTRVIDWCAVYLKERGNDVPSVVRGLLED